MKPTGARPTPDEGDARITPELEMAARVADDAAEEALRAERIQPDEQRTLAKAADADYEQAIDDIAFLVAMRREVSHSAVLAEAGDLSPDDPDEPDRVDTIGVWGPFELIERLGGGASGEVYKVRDRHLKNYVALKLFHEERVANVELDALLVEGRRHALVKHPNIAVIHGADENDGRVGIWMEYIDGATLQELVETQGTFGAAEAVIIARELCSALAAVHQQELTHGDIKAQNVMREKGGRIVLMDFSSSRHVELEDESSGGLVGTPIYMAPELFDGRPSDFRSDIYALGVLLFYLATGRHPFEADNLRRLKEAVSTGRPLLLDDLRPDLPPGFIRAVNKATARAPEDRFQSAGEFQAALRDAVAGDRSDSVTGYSPQATPDLSVLVRAARVVTWSVCVTAFLAFLGYSNEFFYNMALQIPHKFTDYSLVAAAAVGLRALSFLIVLGVMGTVVVAIVWGLMRLVGFDPIAYVARRWAEELRHVDFTKIAAAFALVAVASVASTIAYFSDFLNAIGAVKLETGADLSLLRWACGGEPVHAIRFGLTFSSVVLVLTLGWFIVFEKLNLSRRLSPTARVMKWVSALAIVVAVGVMATPWRLLWQNNSVPMELAGRKAYIVAEEDDELYVYAPDAPVGERHLVMQRDDPRVTRVGATPEYIFGEERCVEGGGS